MWEALAAGVVLLLLLGGLIIALVAASKKGAVSSDDLKEAEEAQKVQARAERAMEAERKRNEDL
jgi:sensor domain CHASE-containing protein